MMVWKTCNNAVGCAKTNADLEKDFATIQSFGASHVYLFCGFVTPNGSFAVVPNPPQRWGILSICRQAAVLIASTANMSYSIIVESRLDFFPGPNAGLQKLIHDGGARFGAEAAAVLASFPQPTTGGGIGLQLDFERGKDKTWPLPTNDAFNRMVSGIASKVPGGVGIAVSQCPYLSDYQQLLSSGAVAVNDMDLYHAANRSNYDAKLQVSLQRLGTGSRDAFAAGVSLFPLKNGWEDTNAGLHDRLAALDAAGIHRVNMFCWPLLGFPSAAPPELVKSWAETMTKWKNGELANAPKTDDDSAEDAASLLPAVTRGLRAFWPLQEPAGDPKVDSVNRYVLHDDVSTGCSPATQAAGPGLFGPHAAGFDGCQRLWAKRSTVPGLASISGSDATVTLVVWMSPSRNNFSSYLAGLWREDHPARQYAMFLNDVK